MIISIIVAVSENRVIGSNGQLPWRLSADLQQFKKITTGHTVIMGRKTYESIGRPLPRRTNIIITRNQSYHSEGCHIVHSLEEALAIAKEYGEEEAFIIGGGEIYQQSLAFVHKIYLSQVKTHLEGDTFFPDLDDQQWHIIRQIHFKADERNEYDFDFIEMMKNPPAEINSQN